MENLSQVLLFIIMGLICVLVLILRRLKTEKQQEQELKNNKSNELLANMLKHICTGNGVTAGISVVTVEEQIKIFQWEIEMTQKENPIKNPKVGQQGLVIPEREVIKSVIELIEENKYALGVDEIHKIGL